MGVHVYRSSDHKITPQEYYDKYLKKDPKEGTCPICGEPTNFITFVRGYEKTCSRKCATIKQSRDRTGKSNGGTYKNTDKLIKKLQERAKETDYDYTKAYEQIQNRVCSMREFRIDIYCKKHDHWFRQRMNSHVRIKQGCPKCGKDHAI